MNVLFYWLTIQQKCPVCKKPVQSLVSFVTQMLINVTVMLWPRFIFKRGTIKDGKGIITWKSIYIQYTLKCITKEILIQFDKFYFLLYCVLCIVLWVSMCMIFLQLHLSWDDWFIFMCVLNWLGDWKYASSCNLSSCKLCLCLSDFLHQWVYF